MNISLRRHLAARRVRIATLAAPVAVTKPILGALLATAALAVTPAGCITPHDCGTVTACKFVDLLAGCGAQAGCAHSGTLQVTSSDDLQDPTAVQTTTFAFERTMIALGPNSSVQVPVGVDATTVAALPLLEITVTVPAVDADQLSIAFNGQLSTLCPPQTGATATQWTCTLPAGTQAVELRVVDATVSDVSITLTEPTCTGTAPAPCGE
jgi:hypothetical protein